MPRYDDPAKEKAWRKKLREGKRREKIRRSKGAINVDQYEQIVTEQEERREVIIDFDTMRPVDVDDIRPFGSVGEER